MLSILQVATVSRLLDIVHDEAVGVDRFGYSFGRLLTFLAFFRVLVCADRNRPIKIDSHPDE